MCGRFAFYSSHEAIARLFGVVDAASVEPRYNIAPTQFVPVVRTDHAAVRRLAMLYWGLIPGWAKEKAIGARMINARVETARDKPAFRAAYRKHRCIVLADGYYEWQQRPDGKQPWFIRTAVGEPFAMAGLWESWLEKPGEPPLESCAILTGEPTAPLAGIHNRMPVVLPPQDYAAWLDPKFDDADKVDALLAQRSHVAMQAVPVSRRVNNARNEGAELITPAGEPLQAP
jgi:putative SOS response-associated peptidase YedK